MGEPLEAFSSTRKCASCGKLITVLWPQQWAYKRGTPGHEKYYLCSWKCLRLFDKAKEEKERKRMAGRRVVSLETEEEAVRVALEGGDPLQVLEAGGATDPAKKWYQMKVKMRDSDPETLAKLPKRIQRKDAVQRPVETPEGEYSAADAMEGMKKAADEFFMKVGLSVETPEITKPVGYDGFTVRAVEGDFGSYHFQEINGKQWIDFENNEMADPLSMTVEQWRRFLEELRKAALVLGVEL